MQERQLQHNGHLLNYNISGQGKPVMFIHGFGEDATIWADIAAVLSESYLLIIPDIPGTGKSDLLPGENAGIDDYAECMYAILTNESIEKCTIIGHSMGGYITLAFAEKYPEKLHAFGLFHSSGYADDEAKKETRKKAIEFMQQNGGYAFLKTSIPGLFAGAEKSKEYIQALIEKSKEFKTEALIQYYRAMIARPDRTTVLKTFTRPVLFILGKHDKAVPFDQGLKQSHLPAISHIDILEESGHMGMLEEQKKSLLKLAHFLAAIYV